MKSRTHALAALLDDQSGTLWVPAGKKLSVNDLYAINRLVKGVIGSPQG